MADEAPVLARGPCADEWTAKRDLVGSIKIPYRWTTGADVERFYMALRDEGLIYGTRCTGCGRVLCPPQEFCGRCYVPTEGWIQVGPEGTVTTYTLVRQAPRVHPVPAPYAVVAVRLDGADTDLLHLVTRAPEKMRVGTRVRAIHAPVREGRLFDLAGFEAVVV